MKPKMIVVGDAACPSGFARATHAYLDAVKDDFDVTVLGLNYRGDPHEYPYPIYTAYAGGDTMGIGRLVWLCDLVTITRQEGARRVAVPVSEQAPPDVIVIQNDPWNFPFYFRSLRAEGPADAEGKRAPAPYRDVPVIGIVAVDGKNCPGHFLKDLTMAIFWTQFGMNEAKAGGYEGPAVVIPLGVDLETYKPVDKIAARRRRGLPPEMDDVFIVGNVNRNQPRKRLDLTIKYFAEWVHSGPLKDAYLYMHVAPTGDAGIDVLQMANYYGIGGRLGLVEPPAFIGLSEEDMRDTYNIFDVQVNTGQGEGFGLTTIEGMACGVSQLVGDWAGLGSWARDAARLVPCTSTAINPIVPGLNIIGGVPDERVFVREIESLYRNREARTALAIAGLRRANDARFHWSYVGEAFRLIVNHVLRETGVEAAIA